MTASARDRQQARKRAAQERARLERQRRRARKKRIIIGVVVGAVTVGAAIALWPRPDGGDDRVQNPLVPAATVAQNRTWTATLETSRGDMSVELDGAAAPQAVSVVVTLMNQGFYNNTDCHRLTTELLYVLQCGDPTGTGTGDPGYRFGPIENDPADEFYPAGTVAMARQPSDAMSMGSQFFIVYEDSYIPADDAGGYTVIGTVTEGLDVVRDIAEGGTITGATDGPPALSVILTKVVAS